MGHERAGDAGAQRFDVRSVDGTSLAVWVEGAGPPLVLVHGALSDHTTFDTLIAELRDDLTTFSVDRRGHGASGDGVAYAIEREFEDVATVIDAVTAGAGAPVALWGHSYGANCAMGGAALTDGVGRLVLYEPGLATPYPPGSIDAIEQAVAAGDAEAAILALLVGILEVADEDIAALRADPRWPLRLANVPTLPRELRAEERWVYQPGRFDGITGRTVVLAGSESPPVQDEATRRAVAAIPGAQLQVLEGHGHMAHQIDPAMVAAVIRKLVTG